MSDSFYRAFEDKYRGSRELIKSRLHVYLPFVLPLLECDPLGSALDLGCGRGEWLEMLNEYGFNTQGVDLDDGMLQACRDIGLNVQTADAITFLKGLPDKSQLVVSGFHIAEHLSFDSLLQMVNEARRVLKPGGVLILETPNPDNIYVGTSSFYLDPTHQSPIPQETLRFLAEFCGYDRVKVIGLQQGKDIKIDQILNISNVIFSVSPDYALVAQTEFLDASLPALDDAFLTEYGVSLQQITARYQEQLSNSIQQADLKAQQADLKAQQAITMIRELESKALSTLIRKLLTKISHRLALMFKIR